MLSSDIPSKFSIPWANAAAAANKRTIPTASQLSIQSGAASLTDGFPPLNFVPVAAGGIPPFGQDMNGILSAITQWNRWQAAGAPVRYDSTFSISIGGYPAGALVLSNSGHAVYESLIDANTSDPNGGFSSDWRVQSSVWSAGAWKATGSANIQLLSLTPAPASLSQLLDIPLIAYSQGVNTGPVTLNVNGLGPIPIVVTGGIAVGAGALSTGYPFCVVYNGGAFVFISYSSVFNDPATAGVTVFGTGTQGANIALLGNGPTTPNKFLRAWNGVFSIVNSAVNAIILTLSDTGTLTIPGGLLTGSTIAATTGNITATAGRLRAGLGASGSGDPSAAAILSDFTYTGVGGDNAIMLLPNGARLLVFSTSITGTGTTVITFPAAFPVQCNSVMVCFDGNTPPGVAGSICASLANPAQCTVTSAVVSGGPYGVTIWALGS